MHPRCPHRHADFPCRQSTLLLAGRRRGFSLQELALVLTLFGTVAAIAAPSLLHAQDKARDTVLKAQLDLLRGAIESYARDHGEYPGFAVVAQLTCRTNGLGETNCADIVEPEFRFGPYLRNIPQAPVGENAGSSVVSVVVGDTGPVPPPMTPPGGWLYNKANGEIWLLTKLHPEYHSY